MAKKNRSKDHRQVGCGNGKMTGGDAAAWGTKVYGTEPTAGPDGFVVKMNPQPQHMTGGWKNKKSKNSPSASSMKKHGGSTLVDLAVPAGMIMGQRAMMSRRNKSMKKHGGSTLVDLAVPAGMIMGQRAMLSRRNKSKKNFSRRYGR